jgi:hypothetical protein
MKLKYQLHVKSQRSRGAGGPGKFGGPDTYVAVTIAPDGAEVPAFLNRHVLARRGITIKYFGEGYRSHDGPRSALGQAIARARQFIRDRESGI